MFKTLLQADTKEDGNFALCEYFTVFPPDMTQTQPITISDTVYTGCTTARLNAQIQIFDHIQFFLSRLFMLTYKTWLISDISNIKLQPKLKIPLVFAFFNVRYDWMHFKWPSAHLATLKIWKKYTLQCQGRL